MFWSGNYIAVRELNFLLKEENVSLTQVLEADDILQECKADNKALIQFLTKPEILAELITLITEEPSKNVELASQYRHASIACEVLTSQLSMLSDRLSLDTVQMNRLCDFINREPPLNPLLASYFSKTVEMLLERSPKQDWYLYHIVCLRVLDFFKSRRDFLPNLLRHLATSAIADTFKYFIRLDDLFNKIVMEWLEEHQFLESLIQIICGTYVAEAPPPPREPAATAPPLRPPRAPTPPASPSQPEKGEREHSEKLNCNHTHDDAPAPQNDTGTGGESAANNNGAESEAEAEAGEAARALRRRRTEAVASANAAGLLCDLVLNGCAGDACTTRARTGWALVERLADEDSVRRLLQGMFTAPAHARAAAIVNGCHVLLALLHHNPIVSQYGGKGERSSVELAVAPHLPLLHQALLQEPAAAGGDGATGDDGSAGGDGAAAVRPRGAVGAARVQVAALLAALAASGAEEVCTTMLTLGTPGALLDLFLRYPNNNFLHAQVLAFVRNALDNLAYRSEYAHHLVAECDVLTRLMAVFEENETKMPRDGHAGHVTLLLAVLGRAMTGDADDDYLHVPGTTRFALFECYTLRPVMKRRDTPLGGYYPSENIYEVDGTADAMGASYDFKDPEPNDSGVHSLSYAHALAGLADLTDLSDFSGLVGLAGPAGPSGFGAAPAKLGGIPEVPEVEGGEGGHADFGGFEEDPDKMMIAKSSFLELSTQRFDDDMWADGPEAEADGKGDADGEGEGEAELGEAPLSRLREVLAEVSPWESGSAEAPSGGEGWAQFGGDAFPPPVDPFARSDARGCDEGPSATAAPAPPAPAASPPTDTKQLFERQEFSSFWPSAERDVAEASSEQLDVAEGVRSLQLEQFSSEQERTAAAELASNLLSAMSGMAPDLIANIVNANISPLHLPQAPATAPAPPSPPPPPPSAPSDETDDKASDDIPTDS